METQRFGTHEEAGATSRPIVFGSVALAPLRNTSHLLLLLPLLVFWWWYAEAVLERRALLLVRQAVRKCCSWARKKGS